MNIYVSLLIMEGFTRRLLKNILIIRKKENKNLKNSRNEFSHTIGRNLCISFKLLKQIKEQYKRIFKSPVKKTLR